MNTRVRIWTYDKYDTEKSLYTPSVETRVPLQASCSKVKNGKLPVSQSGISLSRKGVALTAFGPNPDGEGTIFRVWEQGGISGKLEVTLPSGAKFNSAVPVNLRGEKTGEPIKISGGKVLFDLHAYAPVSLILN
jgi:hypothetical protein